MCDGCSVQTTQRTGRAGVPATVRVSAATICSVEHGLRFIPNLPFLNGEIASRQIFLGLFGATFYNNS